MVKFLCVYVPTVIQKFWSDYLNSGIFGDFLNDFRPKIEILEKLSYPPFWLFLGQIKLKILRDN